MMKGRLMDITHDISQFVPLRRFQFCYFGKLFINAKIVGYKALVGEIFSKLAVLTDIARLFAVIGDDDGDLSKAAFYHATVLIPPA